GLRTPTDVQIEFVGLRPGEKMHEELFFPDEIAAGTEHPRVLRAQSPVEPIRTATLLSAVQRIEQLVEDGNEVGALQTLHDILAIAPPPPPDAPQERGVGSGRPSSSYDSNP